MITKTESFPKRSNKGLQGQDILWTQFNDISFFIEDDFQENLYFQILKKLFPKIKLSKIFPLGGKPHVIQKAQKSILNKKKIFIVDNDFDAILKLKKAQPNLFYLQRYSIENYLFESHAINELIREERPTIKLSTIKSQFSFSGFINESSSILSKLCANFLLIRKFELGLSYLSIDPNRDCDLISDPKIIRNSAVQNFYADVQGALKNKRPRLKYSKQVDLAEKYFKLTKSLQNIPGKYLINLLKILLKKIFNFAQCSIDSFIYRLAKNCNFSSLTLLKKSIEVYTT